MKQLHKVKQTDTKKQRLQSEDKQLRLDEAMAKKERDGTDRSGQNMDEVTEDAPNNSTKKKRSVPVCKHCGKKGHSTTRSKNAFATT